ncbi:hypothetical protein TNCV_2035921 [Trichonephila clavipes]|nr:hypothetical protein TNCV_2035921 [Trichonephila clavipes]
MSSLLLSPHPTKLAPNFLCHIPIHFLSTANKEETHYTASSNRIAPSHHNSVPHRTSGCLRHSSLHHLDSTESSSITNRIPQPIKRHLFNPLLLPNTSVFPRCYCQRGPFSPQTSTSRTQKHFRYETED